MFMLDFPAERRTASSYHSPAVRREAAHLPPLPERPRVPSPTTTVQTPLPLHHRHKALALFLPREVIRVDFEGPLVHQIQGQKGLGRTPLWFSHQAELSRVPS